MTVEEHLRAAMTPAERENPEFLERVAIIEEGCKCSPVEALHLARKQWKNHR